MAVIPGASSTSPSARAPVDAGIVVVDPMERALGHPFRRAQGVIELTLLTVHRHPVGEEPNTPGVVVVQVAETDGDHVVELDADGGEGDLHRIPLTGHQFVVLARLGEPAQERLVEDQRRVEAGVEQEPPAVHLEQDPGHRFAHADGRVGPEHRHGLRQVLPTERQRDDPPYPGPAHDGTRSSSVNDGQTSGSWPGMTR